MMGKGRFLTFRRRRVAKKEGGGLKLFGTAGLKWKRLNFKMSFLEALKFKILSVFEVMILVSKLAFFYLCCGCKF
ncbi:PREDICTED: uncharacterized protein LOC104806122 [Tarenaya hassleriana]|uniref:uncharacterized protein LOC104806122 n=1 Tax=Tarenaya hassleriana TaxID=28532 RepID=UPI00053C1AE3|nr:PREDICTED: uncharacterized protein LOC104806122 [Tarenaya hassleriana]